MRNSINVFMVPFVDQNGELLYDILDFVEFLLPGTTADYPVQKLLEVPRGCSPIIGITDRVRRRRAPPVSAILKTQQSVEFSYFPLHTAGSSFWPASTLPL